MGAFTGKTILITGASEGIGRALALVLARDGAKLALAARGAQRLEEARRECAALGAQVETVVTDVARPRDCVRRVERAVTRFGDWMPWSTTPVSRCGRASRPLATSACSSASWR